MDEFKDINGDGDGVVNDGNEVIGQDENWRRGFEHATNVRLEPSNDNEIDGIDFGTDCGSSNAKGSQWNIDHV